MPVCTPLLRFAFAFTVLLPGFSNSQGITGNFLKEPVHLHTDKETYLPGDTVWFKAYLKPGNLVESISTNLLTKLVDGDGNILSSALWPLFDGTSKGSFILPQTIPSKGIFISAFTNKMLQAQKGTVYAKEISMINGGGINTTNNTQPEMLYFPEGGNLVQEISNHIIFKWQAGRDLNENIFTLKDSKGEVIDTVQIPYGGLGHFKLTPIAGESYYAEFKNAGRSIKQVPLVCTNNGKVALHVEELKGHLFYMVEKPENLDADELFVTATMDGDTVYKARLNLSTVSVMAGKLPLNGIPGGYILININDKNNEILSQRLYYIKPTEIIAKADINVIKKDLSPGGFNTLEIKIADTMLSNLSLAVFDANFEAASSHPSILTDLLFPGVQMKDIPASFFSASMGDSINSKELDYFIQANISPNLKETGQRQVKESIDNYLSFEGELLDQKNRPIANEDLMMITQLADSGKTWNNIKTDKNGKFTQSGLVFNDSAMVFFRFKNKDIDPGKVKLKLSAIDYSPEVKFLNLYSIPVKNDQLNPDLAIYQSEKIKTVELGNVTVTAIKQEGDAMYKLDKKYTSGYFTGGATAYAIDVANDDMATNKFDIYNYLAGKIPQLRIKYISSSAGSMKRFDGNYVYFINESQVDAFAVDQLILKNIAYVKYFRRFGALPGMPEAICIYLKKDGDWKNEPGELLKQSMAGYNSEHIFNAPDYSGQAGIRADFRTTLHWEPSIILNKDQQKVIISFYNNSVCKKMKVVLEGINENGQLIRVEKLIN